MAGRLCLHFDIKHEVAESRIFNRIGDNQIRKYHTSLGSGDKLQ